MSISESAAREVGASVSGMCKINGRSVVKVVCQNFQGCDLEKGLQYLLHQGDDTNYRITINLFGVPTEKDPFRCILFTAEGLPHPDPGNQWPKNAAVCGTIQGKR
jgi:hypothetical protein